MLEFNYAWHETNMTQDILLDIAYHICVCYINDA